MQTATRAYKVITPDNGYFVRIERTACGHLTEVDTESIQWGVTAAKRNAVIERHVETRACGRCAAS